jgi:hypothetical protein
MDGRLTVSLSNGQMNRIEIKFNVSGGTLEAWGKWLCRT